MYLQTTTQERERVMLGSQKHNAGHRRNGEEHAGTPKGNIGEIGDTGDTKRGHMGHDQGRGVHAFRETEEQAKNKPRISQQGHDPQTGNILVGV